MEGSARVKVLYVIPGLGVGGGAERSLLEMAPGLAEAGIELHIAYFHERSSSAVPAFEAIGVPVTHLLAGGLVGRVAALRRLLRRVRPDVVHTTLFEADVAGRLAAVGTGTPVLTSLVNTSYEPVRLDDGTHRRWRVEVVRMVEGFTLRHLTTLVHANSEAVRASAVRWLRVRPDRVRVVRRGRDAERLGRRTEARRDAARAELAVAHDERMVLSVGRHEHQKGQIQLIEALPAVLERHPEVVVIVAGREGTATGLLTDAIARLGVGDRVRLLGHRDEVANLMVGADVLAFPSRWEGLPGTIIEAMALELPIVATSIPPTCELVDPSSAILVGPGDAAAMAAGIVAVLDDPEAAAGRAARARARFEAEFTVEQMLAGMTRLYREVAA
jgi:glycosyltransferase involved in cell wall biosynthesis